LVAHGVIIADDEYITRYYPSYAQAVKSQRGYSEELKWVIVELEVCNATDGDIKASLVNLHAQTGAWTNGVDMLLFADMNEGSGTILSLGLGEEKQLWVPFLLSKGQFGYRDDWYRIDEKEYELVLATYPDKVYISLGKPDKAGSNNPRTYNGQSTDAAFSLQEEGQVG
jgi:hypothetical protein